MRKYSILDMLIFIVLMIYLLTFLKSEFNICVPVTEYVYSIEYLWYYLPHDSGVQPKPMEKAPYLKEFILNNDIYYAGSPDEKAIYLTFDDCPSNNNIPMILDILDEHKATAAFFMTKKYIRDNPEIIRRITDSGYLVCNHTSNHVLVARMSFEKLKQELAGVEEAYREVTGKELPRYFRPPQGAFTLETLDYAKRLGYKVIFWSFKYVDWEINRQPTKEKALFEIISQTHPGEIALLHCQSKTNVKVLNIVLDEWVQEGYTFKSLDELPVNQNPDLDVTQ